MFLKKFVLKNNHLEIWKALVSASKSEGGREVTESLSLHIIGWIQIQIQCTIEGLNENLFSYFLARAPLMITEIICLVY